MDIKTVVWSAAAVFLCAVNVALAANHTCNCEGGNHTIGGLNIRTFGNSKWNGDGYEERRPILADVSTT